MRIVYVLAGLLLIGSLSGCGDSTEQGGKTEQSATGDESVFDPMISTMDKARSVEDLSVEASSGYKVLDRAATRTVSRWSFEPATRAGIPVSSKARIPVRFRLEGR